MTTVTDSLFAQASTMAKSSFINENELRNLPSMTRAQLDALEYGAVKVDDAGVIELYNRYEAELANIQPADAIRKLKAHLEKHGFGHIEVQAFDGAEPPYKISVKEDISQAIIAAATEVYGDPRRWREICDANNLHNPMCLPPGKQLIIPPKRAASTARPRGMRP